MTSSDFAALPIVDTVSQLRFEIDKFVLDHVRVKLLQTFFLYFFSFSALKPTIATRQK